MIEALTQLLADVRADELRVLLECRDLRIDGMELVTRIHSAEVCLESELVAKFDELVAHRLELTVSGMGFHD